MVMPADWSACVTVLPAGTVRLRDLPSAMMLMVMSALVTCGERQPASKEIARKAEMRNRLGGLALSRCTERRSRVEVEIEVMRCIGSSGRLGFAGLDRLGCSTGAAQREVLYNPCAI